MMRTTRVLLLSPQEADVGPGDDGLGDRNIHNDYLCRKRRQP